MFQYFYNSQFRKLILAFGSFFDSIYVTRDDANKVEKQRILVPITYGPKEKWLIRITQDPEFLRGVNTVVPRMSYEMTGISYDSNRKLNTLHQLKYPSSESQRNNSIYVGVPYTINIELALLVKYQQDGFQVVEQILPYFTPDLTFAIKLLDDVNLIEQVPLTLNGVSHSDNYEGDFEKRRIIIWTFNFTLKTNFYGPVRAQSRIEEVQVDLYDSALIDLDNPPEFLTNENGDFLVDESGNRFATEATDDGYLTTGLIQRVVATADPVDQQAYPPNVRSTTTITTFDGGIKRSHTGIDEEII